MRARSSDGFGILGRTMREHRLGRLASLTQGAALVGLGLVQTGCGKDGAPPTEPPHVNAPPQPTMVVAAPDAGPLPPPTTNDAPPTTNAAPTIGAVDAGAPRPTLNAPPKKIPPAPGKP
jgi:hypothetical protein